MKKLSILLGILLMGVVFAAQANAVTINTPWPANGSGAELNLDTIATGWGFTVTNAQLQAATPLQTLAAGNYTILHAARYADNDNDGGVYTSVGSAPSHGATPGSVGGTLLAGLDVANGSNAAVNIPISPISTFGFLDYDDVNNNLMSTQNQNASVSPLFQSSGFIFNLGLINAAYAGNYLVAFEDGGSNRPFGDADYNDLVFEVKANAVPLPPSLLLFGSGLVGLAGLRRYRKN